MNVCLITKKNAKNYYAKLQWKDRNGEWHSKSITTGVPIKGNNKRRAQKVAEDLKSKYEQKYEDEKVIQNDILFVDFLYSWIKSRVNALRISTYETYYSTIDKIIVPYFKPLNLTLADVTPFHLQTFYNKQSTRVSNNTIKHYHVYIHSALKYAVKQNLIAYNPADRVEIAPIEKKHGNPFTKEQLITVVDACLNTPIGIAVAIGAYCGLRRSEICGLEWEDIDFVDDIIHIRKTRVKTTYSSEVFERKTKSKSSTRDLPLPQALKTILIKEQEKQKINRNLLNEAYVDNNFICVWDNGTPITGDYITKTFRKISDSLGYKEMTFHSLRHTVGSIMSNSGKVSLRTVQDYLGHSDISTTQIYVHPDWETKQNATNVLMDILESVD